MASNPPMMWAQDRTRVFITIKLQDVRDEEIIFEPGHFLFKGRVVSPDVFYDYTFQLFEDVLPDHPETKYSKFGRYLQLNLRKKDDSIWWPRLAKTANKLHHVRVDWDKWVDCEFDVAPAKKRQRRTPKKTVAAEKPESTGSSAAPAESG
jgi:prostaglandin-E synthase